jgi:predicted porin
MPYISTSEYEAGVEYQIMKALELTVAYSDMNRTNDSTMYQQANGSLLRMQLQFNY